MSKKREIVKCVRCQEIISNQPQKRNKDSDQRSKKLINDLIDDEESQKILGIEIKLSFSCCLQCQKTITPETANYLAKQQGVELKKLSKR